MAGVRGRRPERDVPVVLRPPGRPGLPGRSRLIRPRTAFLRAAYRVGHRLLTVYWLLARPTKRGVVCVLTRGDEVLLVRHTYGRRWQWDLPGGGKHRGEEPPRAVEREIREELGIEPKAFVLVGELFERIGGKHDQLWCFSTEIGEEELSPSPVEIAEARWFPRESLPQKRARYVDRVMRLTAPNR